MLEPFVCHSCNAPLAVADAESVVCAYCGAANPVPAAHRAALEAARNLDTATREAAAEWARLDRIRIPRWLALGPAVLAFGLIAGGIGAALALALLRPATRLDLPRQVGFGVWLPLVPLVFVATRTGLRNLLVSGAAVVARAFAARRAAEPGAPDQCRQCGAPLDVRPDDVVARCLYCGVESIVALDASRREHFSGVVGLARTSLADAMQAIADRAAFVELQTRGRMAVIAGLLVLPLVWSFAGRAVQSSWWSLAISLDVWVLGVCVFWYVREALLPPVTVEELASVVAAGSGGEDAARPDGTRGWYDNAFDAVNFAVPAAVAIMYAALAAAVVLGT